MGRALVTAQLTEQGQIPADIKIIRWISDALTETQAVLLEGDGLPAWTQGAQPVRFPSIAAMLKHCAKRITDERAALNG